jgi:hypothetical protein
MKVPGAQQNVEPQAGGDLFQDIQLAAALGSGCRPSFGGVGLAALCGCFLAAADEVGLGGLSSGTNPKPLHCERKSCATQVQLTKDLQRAI